MSTLSTHVLDTSLGRPAAGIRVMLERDGVSVGSAVTDADGRAGDILPPGSALTHGQYTLTFFVGEYFSAMSREGFYSRIAVDFHVGASPGHYHVPLLLSPFGYSTYRGS